MRRMHHDYYNSKNTSNDMQSKGTENIFIACYLVMYNLLS